MKTKIKGLLLVAGAMLSLTSCSDWLDMDPTDQVSDKLVWATTESAELIVNNLYEDVASFGSYHNYAYAGGMTEALTDEFKYGSITYNAQAYIPSETAYGGTVLTANYVDSYFGNWGRLYSWIAKTNNAISKLREFGQMSEKDKTRIEAELRFFRAFYYFQLTLRYKDIIIYDENMTDYKADKALSSEEDAWNFVEKDFRFAAEILPTSITPNGRVTSGAAYGMLSRAMLYAKRWDVANEAADKVIAMGYSFSSSLNGPFQEGGTGAVFQIAYNLNARTNTFDYTYVPGADFTNAGKEKAGGAGVPTQEMVESFELATGGLADWSPWHSEEGTDRDVVTEVLEKLEPRFANTILYNGATWKGRAVEPYDGGADGFAKWKKDAEPAGRTVTGYYLRKLLDENHDLGVNTSGTQPWTAIRIEEIYLNKAEACANITGKTSEAIDALNKVRTRAAVNLPAAPNSLSGADLMAVIQHERKVELAYEGQYYWDMRRWGLAHTAFSGYRVHGLKPELQANGTFKYYYIECDTEDRNFPTKMYRFPLPSSELSNNSLVTQFTEWN